MTVRRKPKRTKSPLPVELVEVGKRLKERRKERKLGVVELGELAGVDKGTVSELESQGPTKLVSLATVFRLAKALEVHLEWLATGREPKELGGTVLVIQAAPERVGAIRDKVLAELDTKRES